MKTHSLLLLLLLPLLFSSCSEKKGFKEDFNRYNDRTWISEQFWPIPLEDWKIADGRVECTGEIANMRLNLLTYAIDGEETFTFSVNMGTTNTYQENSDAGVRIAIRDDTDDDIRSLCYFGHGIDIGVNTAGKLFIDTIMTELPADFDFSDFTLTVIATALHDASSLLATCEDRQGRSAMLQQSGYPDLNGTIALVQNFAGSGYFRNHPKFWFDDITLRGANLASHPENTFGPVLFTMYTLEGSELHLTAQFPPLGENDQKEARLEVDEGGTWRTIQHTTIEMPAWIAPFRIADWDTTAEHRYRVVYTEGYADGSEQEFAYEGTIRKEPEGEELVMGGLTCQNHVGYPYRPVVENLAESDPDMLYFSGDQIYEGNGGYGIVRRPADRAILNYLGKWYMFGWTFGEVMKDRPTICIPDDHEVYQGNLWGAGGKTLTVEEWQEHTDCTSGFVQPVEMVNVVIRTNCSHLPDPADPAPMKNGILTYYTDLEYGGVDFAIVGDRIFKSGPENVATWEGRLDHLKKPLKDPSILEKEGLTLLGGRQMRFLEDWVADWDGKQIKVLLSQTPFTYSTTHHGANRMYLEGDLDSGGWPKQSRDSVLRLIRKCKAFHITGDQHISSMVQYGVDEFRDAGWVFCTPAIAVGYPRRFLPDMLGWEVHNRPEHGLPNTGEYTDGFGNKNYVYAIANPDDLDRHSNRYKLSELKASGYGVIHFDKADRTVTCESVRFLGDLSQPEKAQFPGWPVTIDLDQSRVESREPGD